MTVPFVLPPLVVDTREQSPLVFPAVVRTRRGTLLLPRGDGEAATRLLNWCWRYVLERRLEAEEGVRIR